MIAFVRSSDFLSNLIAGKGLNRQAEKFEISLVDISFDDVINESKRVKTLKQAATTCVYRLALNIILRGIKRCVLCPFHTSSCNSLSLLLLASSLTT
ncbi:hypothetical protein Golomagni_00605 [Golovinomyces magnicellulatus]|nr:hypothetical protein Golomagni_00605 [Golovinomyces magnicellulatus]